MIGQKIGEYEVTELLGEGGMGMVYKGVHPVLGNAVAIKMLHPTLVSNEGLKKRFIREAQALAKLTHPNIVRLLGYLDVPLGCFIIMEFTKGETIEQKLEKMGLIPPELVVDWFCQTLEALSFAHSMGVIHRDIKPSNIMVLDDGSCRLLDFGTARMVDAERLTRQGMTLGTIIYIVVNLH